MKLQTFSLLITIFFSHLCFGQEITSNCLNNFINNPAYANSEIGLLIIDLNTEEIVLENNAHTSMVPGSILKLSTSAAALEILGEGYRFKTELAYSGDIDPESGKLAGDLIIIGGGDPTLGSEYFNNYPPNYNFPEAWIDSVVAAGISKVDGNIILDGAIYEGQTIPNTWIWEDIGNYYGAGASAISVYDNMFRITFMSASAGEPTRIISISPEVDGLELVNEVISSNDTRDLAYVFGSPWVGKKIIRGTIPENRSKFTIRASMPEPGLVLGDDLIKRLREKGVEIKGRVVKGKSDNKVLKLLLGQKSPRLSEIVKVMNHESINLFAEHLVKQIAYEETGRGATETGVELIKQFWAGKGIDTHGMFLEDGSGLSHFNAITPRQVVDILLFMKKNSTHSRVFENSLPSPGNGTLYVFDPDNFPNGSLKCKSGSMTRVRCYAGYLTTDSGRELVFSFMVNNFEGSHQNIISIIEQGLIGLRED